MGLRWLSWRSTLAALLAFSGVLHAQTATPWHEADKLFHTDPRWLGADAAFSVDLGKGRVLWLFGDTWIAYPGSHSRRNAAFLRDSIAIEQGYDPSHAGISFYWHTKHNQPTEILPSEGNAWMWFGAGICIDNSLVLFAERVVPDHAKNSLGFKSDGWNAYLITNPDSEPSLWKPKKIAEQHDDVIMASALLRQGEFIYLFGESDKTHDLYIARVNTQRLAQGNLGSMEWWTGNGWSTSTPLRQPIIRDAGTETSVQSDPQGDGFIEINSQGFGASDIVMRRSAALTGPWREAKTIYRPPESDEPDPFVYAAKSHAELRGADLVLTYATNGFTDRVADDLTRYFPRFVRVTLRTSATP